MTKNLKSVALSLLLGLALIACGANAKSIKAKPQKYVGKEVTLSGVVRNVVQINAVGKTPAAVLYQLDDHSAEGDAGMIWVLRGTDSSQKAVPNQNLQISLKGVVEAERVVQKVKYSPLIIEKSSQQEIPKEGPNTF